MNKLVLKTVLFTLLAIAGVLCVTFFALFLFSPKTLGSVSKSLGNEKAAVFFYEKQYEKTDSAEDLAAVIDLYDSEKDAETVFSLSEELVKKADFQSFCERKDDGASGIKTAEFYYAKYAVSAYLFKGGETSAEICKEGVLLSGYTEYNAFRYVMTSVELSITDKAVFTAKISSLTPTMSLAELAVASQDLSVLAVS